VLVLALFAFFLQATLPFLVTNCPLEHAGQSMTRSFTASTQAMPADCPMMADARQSQPSDQSPADQHRKHFAFCALCNALSPFQGYVAAGLLSLPPPGNSTELVSFAAVSLSAPSAPTGSFSARAPPFPA
jgi:hypothetical protein